MSKVRNETKSGVTLTKNADGSITLSAESAVEESVRFLYYASYDSGWTYPAHKYILGGTGNVNVQIVIYKNNSLGIGSTKTSAVIIDNLSTNDVVTGFGFFALAGFVGFVTFTPTLIDLTLMFGAGNEPSTVEEFERLFPQSYYANVQANSTQNLF